ncbi:MAG: hypothetical protein HY246_08185 [Proteobacteria bacterium]|nr:hypothetical protein [Pseudomonadota bacterium]
MDEMPTGVEGEWIELTLVDDPDIVVRLDLTSYGQYLNDRVLRRINAGAAVS